MDPSVTSTAEWLKTYGPWALLVVTGVVIVVLWRRLSAKDDAALAREEVRGTKHAEKIESIMREHKSEMAILLDRVIAASATQVDKIANLAEQNSRLAEALGRRVRSAKDSQQP